MATLQEASRTTFSAKERPTHENINAGSLQRIADALEKLNVTLGTVSSERDYYKRIAQSQRRTIRRLKEAQRVRR